eukprot:2108598-Rhodomonas_salina.2
MADVPELVVRTETLRTPREYAASNWMNTPRSARRSSIDKESQQVKFWDRLAAQGRPENATHRAAIEASKWQAASSRQRNSESSLLMCALQYLETALTGRRWP